MKPDIKTALKELILNHKDRQFTFDELCAAVPSDYDSLKEALFELLSEKPSILVQEFDAGTEKIVFRGNVK